MPEWLKLLIWVFDAVMIAVNIRSIARFIKDRRLDKRRLWLHYTQRTNLQSTLTCKECGAVYLAKDMHGIDLCPSEVHLWQTARK